MDIDTTVQAWNAAVATGDAATVDAARRGTLREIAARTMDGDPNYTAAGYTTDATPTPARPRYRPGHARVGEPTPQSHPDRFTDREVAAEFRYLARLNGKYGIHPLRVGAQNTLARVLDARGVRVPCGYTLGTPPPPRPAPAPAPPGRPGGRLYWRGCSGCNTSVSSYDGTSENVWCATCRPKYVQPFDQWAAEIGPKSRVYVQPSVAWRGLSRSEYLVTARDGDRVTVQLIGVPESSITVHIGQCGQHDMTPRR
jgi:hypothetical protein